MNDFNILWIDDEWNLNEKVQYSILSSIKMKIESANPNIKFTIKETIAEGIVAMIQRRKRSYDLIIVDLDFTNEKNKNFDERNSFLDIIENIKARGLKFVIFTSKREKYDISSIIESSKHYLLEIYNKSNPEVFISDIVNLSQFTPIKIIHLSDFHFDSSISGNEETEQSKRYNSLIEFLKKENEAKDFNLIIFSGDFAAGNPIMDHDKGGELFRKIVKSTTNNFSKFVLIPGNHDIIWKDFENNIISPTPAKSFHKLYSDVYDGELDYISQLIGYNEKSESFDIHFEPDSFSVSKQFNNGLVRVLGLNSVLTTSNLKGKGKISENIINFIKKEWSDHPLFNEFRIATFHHNVLPPFSVNCLDEAESLLNSGEMIETLANYGCDLLLGGHCHNSYFYNFSFSLIDSNGFNSIKNLAYVSTGTAGGYSPQFDRARSFNLINIYPTKEPNIKTISIEPVIFDSHQNIWIKKKSLNSLIHQNR